METKKIFDFADDDILESVGEGSNQFSNDMKTGEVLDQYINEVSQSVRDGISQSIEVLTPWFFNNMPRIYYQTTPRAEKVRHLSAIISGHLFETKQTVVLWDRDRTKVTYIGPGSDPEVLHEMAVKLTDFPLKMGFVYLSKDRLLFVASFAKQIHVPLDQTNPRIVEKVRIAKEMILKEFPNEASDVQDYIDNLDNEFVMYATAARIQLTYRMVRYMSVHEGAHTFIEPVPDRPTARVTLGIKQGTPGEAMAQIFNLMTRYGVSLGRCFVVTFNRGVEQPISVIHFHIASTTSDKIDIESVEMKKLNKALRTLGWVDTDEYSAFMQVQYGFSINAVNLVRSWANWIHVMLGKQNPYYYSHYKIRTTFFNYAEITRDLVALFRLKFDPDRPSSLAARGYPDVRQKLYDRIATITDEVEKQILCASLNFIDHTQKTNYFLPTKTGLAFRIAPDILDPKFYPDRPFGIFFIVGRDYRMFHMRWKDIARGGLRVVMPKNVSDYEYALSGIFDEVYGLSNAQQLKNKDIPEGGSKGVLILKPGGDRIHAVRGGVNALLDLLVRDDESHENKIPQVVSYYDKPDILYLGPDENITNDLIEWIPEQAARRGYPYAAAFMSSKPGAGINHKEYGVTSEGLNVFVENILKFIGIDPRSQTFTVKLTGGPDGDVAGNEMKILHREYGAHARVVAVADGFGAAYDPKGLNWDELLRLFNSSESIAQFSPKLLSSKEAFVVKADTPEHIKMRNELHAKVKADIFIPGGGRPYTVNEKTWPLFLDEHGRPSVRAVVEGANIFFTSEARKKLQEQGVLMIKDSSANKTGVICSSFEIIASLTISEQEFLAIKPLYVEQVIEILRQKADAEAKLLFREFSRSGGKRTLVELSMDISREINDVTDVLLDDLTKREHEVLRDPFFEEIICRHCPPVLVEKYRARILDKLPAPHKIAILSAYIASHIVYREGLGWLEKIPRGERCNICIAYMRNTQLTLELMRAVEESGLQHKDKILAILKLSATRDLTLLSMESGDKSS